MGSYGAEDFPHTERVGADMMLVITRLLLASSHAYSQVLI